MSKMTENDAIVPVSEFENRLGIIVARTPHDVIVQATAIAKELAEIVKKNHLSSNIQGRDFVKVEGWSTMGAMLGVLPREMMGAYHEFEDGSCETTVELIRISDGAIIGRGSALVGMDEKDRNGKLTWGNRARYARRSMSVTRATGKAYRLGFSWIMALAGYEPTPAEEMGDVTEGEYKSTNGKPATQPITMTLDEARNVKTKNAKHEEVELRMLNPEQLKIVADKSKDARTVQAASMLIAQFAIDSEPPEPTE
jgi:hypothetical protein